MNFYFFAFVPFQIIPCLGIAQIAKSVNPSVKTTLIIADHPYVKDVQLDYINQFDSVYRLPYCYYEKNIFRGVFQAWKFWNAIKKVPIEPNSIFSFVIGGELVHLLYRRRIEKIPNVLKVRLYHATSIWGKKNKNTRLILIRTILTMFYSCLAGGPMVKVYGDPKRRGMIDWDFRNYQDVDIIFDTVNTEFIETAKNKFENMPYPGKFINLPQKENHIELPKNAIIYFLSTDYWLGALGETQYWQYHNKILDNIARENKDCPLYVKLHFLEPEESLKNIKINNYKAINKKYSAEEIYLYNKEKIKAVYSMSSTACLNASYFGIPSFVTYPLLPASTYVKEAWDIYFSSAPKFFSRIKNWQEFEKISNISPNNKFSYSDEQARWEECIRAIINKVRLQQICKD